VHTGVGAPRDGKACDRSEGCLERRPDFALYRAKTGLSSPAVKPRPVVLEGESKAPLTAPTLRMYGLCPCVRLQ